MNTIIVTTLLAIADKHGIDKDDVLEVIEYSYINNLNVVDEFRNAFY